MPLHLTKIKAMTRPTRILGLGNVILDSTMSVDEKYLKEKDLPLNSQIICRNDEQRAILKTVVEDQRSVLTTGGCCANTLKFMDAVKKNHGQPEKFISTFVGRIGTCEYSKIYREKISENIDHQILIDSEKNLPTGLAAGLTFQENRCLLADLGAVDEGIRDFSLIENDVDLMEFDIFYLPGMFLGSSGTAVIEEIYKVTNPAVWAKGGRNGTHSQNDDEMKTAKPLLAINLSATFLLDDAVLREHLRQSVAYADLIFGNSEEFDKADEHGFDFTDKLVIITHGCDPVQVKYNQEVRSHPMKVKTEVAGDTVAAGDGFVSGFFYQFIELGLGYEVGAEMPFDLGEIGKCVEYGNEIAGMIIQKKGSDI